MIKYKSREYTYKDIIPYFKDGVLSRGFVERNSSNDYMAMISNESLKHIANLITYNRNLDYGVDYRHKSFSKKYEGFALYKYNITYSKRTYICSFIIDDYFEIHLNKALMILEFACGE